MPKLDLDFVRRQFPAFAEQSLRGWSFFENAGGSFACEPVIERLTRFYRETKVQPYAPYEAAERAGLAMDEAYERLAAYLGVSTDEVHLGPSTSQNVYVLAHALRESLAPGDEIVVTDQDHEANSGAWRRLEGAGARVREWRVHKDTGVLDPAELGELLSPRTRLVAFPHCSNVVAHVNPVAEIAQRVKAANPHARIVVDGVSYAPHGFPDVGALGVDAYLFSLYKTYGPHQGLMTLKRDWLDELENQSHSFLSTAVRKKLVPAGPDHAQIAAAAGIADYFDALHAHHFEGEGSPVERARRVSALFQEQERTLLAPLLSWLAAHEDVTVVGPADAAVRAPTVAVRLARHSAADVARALTKYRVMVSSGHFYAVRVLDALGIARDPGVLRLSFVHYTSEDDLAQLTDALDAVLKGAV